MLELGKGSVETMTTHRVWCVRIADQGCVQRNVNIRVSNNVSVSVSVSVSVNRQQTVVT